MGSIPRQLELNQESFENDDYVLTKIRISSSISAERGGLGSSPLTLQTGEARVL